LVCKRDGEEMVVQPWRLRFVLNDPNTWDAASQASVYHLRLTSDAQQRYVSDNESFVEEVFQR
jgi:hypothetical protein